jgi:hypothetical protein
MSLTGVHIAFGSAIGLSHALTGQPTLPYLLSSSQTMSSAGTSTISAPGNVNTEQALLSISASAPIYYCTGPLSTLNINGPTRYMDPSFGREDIVVNSGDYFAWEFA